MVKEPLPSELVRLLGFDDNDAATAAEGLRLLRAFVQIKSPTTRLALIEFAERIAGLAPLPC